jgi:hypothetical protein
MFRKQGAEENSRAWIDKYQKTEGGFMKDLIIEQIERRVRVENDGDFTKAATEYFHDHPEEWQRYKDEVTVVNKRAGEDREEVNAELHYRIEMVAYRDKLDLDKPTDRVAAQAKVFTEYPGLYKRYAAANTVCVRKVSLRD